MFIETALTPFVKARSANASDTSFPSRVPTTTAPTGAGVFSSSRNTLLIVAFGTGNDNQTFDMRVIGWRQIGALWVPVILGQFSCTLSAAVGVAGADVIETERFVDTITLASGFGVASVDNVIVSPANDVIGHIMLDAQGFNLVEFTFDMTGASGGNAIVASL